MVHAFGFTHWNNEAWTNVIGRAFVSASPFAPGGADVAIFHACLRRVHELEKDGVIAGYRAVVNRSAVGGGFIAYVAVGLSEHHKRNQRNFEKAMATAPQVRECHNVTGTIEYILRVEVEDLAAYKHFHTEVLGQVPEVASITSYIVMGSPKDERA